MVPSVLEINQSPGDLNLTNTVGVRGVSVHISPKERHDWCSDTRPRVIVQNIDTPRSGNIPGRFLRISDFLARNVP